MEGLMYQEVAKDYMTYDEAIAYTGLTRGGLMKMVREGRLVRHRIPLASRRAWFLRKDIEALSKPRADFERGDRPTI